MEKDAIDGIRLWSEKANEHTPLPSQYMEDIRVISSKMEEFRE